MEWRQHITKLCRWYICGSRNTAVSRPYQEGEDYRIKDAHLGSHLDLVLVPKDAVE